MTIDVILVLLAGIPDPDPLVFINDSVAADEAYNKVLVEWGYDESLSDDDAISDFLDELREDSLYHYVYQLPIPV